MLRGIRRIDGTLSGREQGLKTLDLPARDNVGVAAVEFFLGLQFIERLLISASGLLNLALGNSEIGLRHRHLSVDLDDAATGGFRHGPLLGIVQLEDRRTLRNFVAELHVDFGDAPICLGNDRHDPEERCGGGGRWVEVEDRRNQTDGEHHAADDAPAQLEPD